MVDNTAILAAFESLGASIAAHKNFEDNMREHVEQLHEQNEMLRKEVRDLKAQIAKKDEEIKALDMQSKAILDATGATVEETYADEDCTVPCANEADCENCDG